MSNVNTALGRIAGTLAYAENLGSDDIKVTTEFLREIEAVVKQLAEVEARSEVATATARQLRDAKREAYSEARGWLESAMERGCFAHDMEFGFRMDDALDAFDALDALEEEQGKGK